MKLKYLIIDDEPIAHDIIQEYSDLLPHLDLVKNCYDALEALVYLNQHSVDLIFLDLNMPKIKGFDFLKTLSNPPKVIVTTAYKEHALEGYELNIIDYLLKPFSFGRFLTAINKVIETTTINQQADEKRIFLRSNKKHIQVALHQIQYLEAAGNYTKVITAEGPITIREKISDLVHTLPPTDFLQVHKSFAVAIQHIKSVEGNRITIGSTVIPSGKFYKLQVKQLLS